MNDQGNNEPVSADDAGQTAEALASLRGAVAPGLVGAVARFRHGLRHPTSPEPTLVTDEQQAHEYALRLIDDIRTVAEHGPARPVYDGSLIGAEPADRVHLAKVLVPVVSCVNCGCLFVILTPNRTPDSSESASLIGPRLADRYAFEGECTTACDCHSS